MTKHLLQSHWEDCLQLYNKEQIFGLFLQGSQNYQLSTELSDVDSKCLLLPKFEDIVLNKRPVSHTHIRKNDEHIDFKDVRNYFSLFRKQNINVVEILFAQDYIINCDYEDYFKDLYELREDVAHLNPWKMCKTIAGMASEKLHSLCHEYPSKLELLNKYGYDAKQLHHIIRLNDFIKRYKSGVPFEECLIPNEELKEKLIAIKKYDIIYTVNEAVEIANKFCEEIWREYSEVQKMDDDLKTTEQLNMILTELIKDKFKKEICN